MGVVRGIGWVGGKGGGRGGQGVGWGGALDDHLRRGSVREPKIARELSGGAGAVRLDRTAERQRTRERGGRRRPADRASHQVAARQGGPRQKTKNRSKLALTRETKSEFQNGTVRHMRGGGGGGGGMERGVNA